METSPKRYRPDILDPMARPSLLTDERAERILTLVRTGLPLSRVAEAVDVGETTLYDWKKRGNAERHRIAEGLKPTKKEAPYLEFLESLERAEAEGEATLLARIQSAARGGGKTTKTTQKSEYDPELGDMVITEQTTVETEHAGQWTAAAWLLERRFPSRWRRRDSLDVTFTPEDLAARLAEVIVEVVNDPDLKLSKSKRAAARSKAVEALREFVTETEA